jgi:hypothetical protein
MAISEDNIVVAGFTGTVGHLLTFKNRAGKTVVAKYLLPTTIPPTERLKSVRKNFASCIAYAKTAIKNPAIKALYQAAAKGGQTAFNVATSDALNPPKLNNIFIDNYHGNPGESITILATDDFKVASVLLSIHLPNGELLEQGEASLPADSAEWIYMSAQPNPAPAGSTITAVATDLPGNTASLDITLS